MKKLTKEQQMQIMHAVNQSIADKKIVMVGSHRVFGAILIDDTLRFWLPTEIYSRDSLKADTLPRMQATAVSNLEKVIVRAFSPSEVDVDVIYEPPKEPTMQCEASTYIDDNGNVVGEIRDITAG